MIEGLMEEIVVWQIGPEEEHVTLNGEEGIPYILYDGSIWLAILKDARVIDSVSLDITKAGGAVSQSREHIFGFWCDDSERLIANKNIVKKVMRNRAAFLDAGFPYWFALHMIYKLLDEASKDENASDGNLLAIKYFGGNNLDVGNQYYILSQAAEAYELYRSEVDSTNRLKLHVKNKSDPEVCHRFGVMYAAIIVALINPCAIKPWDNNYNQQGARSHCMPNKRLAVTLEVLQEKIDKLSRELYLVELVGEENAPAGYDFVQNELITVQKTLEILEMEYKGNELRSLAQIKAINAAKSILTFEGIPCGTNTVEQVWAKFVATAWELTPSQIVSAAKALKKRESQEQK